jgi:hypothetical protein
MPWSGKIVARMRKYVGVNSKRRGVFVDVNVLLIFSLSDQRALHARVTSAGHLS